MLNDFSKDDELNEYIRNIRNYSLKPSELNLLLKSPRLEDKQKFIHGYLIKVVNYAINIYNKLSRYFDLPYSIMDFIQEGNEALIKMVNEGISQDYNLSMFNFTFYTKFKRNVIKNLFPLSESIIERYIDFVEKRDSYLQQSNYDISFEKFGELYGLSVEQVKTLKNCFVQNQSLNYCLDENEIIASGISLEEIVSYLITRGIILETFEEVKLSEREREIIIKYFGFNAHGYNGCGLGINFRELSREYGVCHQRIFQLFNQGIKKIRNNEEVMKKLQLCKRNII